MERAAMEGTLRTAFDELVRARGIARNSMWLGGHHVSSSSRGDEVVVTIAVDRDRCTSELANGFARDLESATKDRFGGARTVVHVTPTTRIEYVFALVCEHVESASAQRAEETLRSGERWVWCATPERIVGWSHGEDRIRLEMVAESSADERAAQELGHRFLADLNLDPELRALIDVVGTSH